MKHPNTCFISHPVPLHVIAEATGPPAQRTAVPHSGQHRYTRVDLAARGQQAVASGDRGLVPSGSVTVYWRALHPLFCPWKIMA